MSIALIRHGQTDWNLAGRVQGHTDIPLNDTGRAQALETAQLLAKTMQAGASRPLQAITSSPLARARETAQIIADHLRLPLLDPLEGLIEQHYGEAEGLPVSELQERWPDRNIPGGEKPDEIAARGMQTLNLLHEKATLEDTKILAITHGAYIRRLVSVIADHDYQLVPGITNAALNEFTKTATAWNILTLNGVPVSEALPTYTPQKEVPKLQMFGSEDASFCTIDGVCY